MSFAVPTVTGFSSFYGDSPNAYAMLYSRSTLERRLSLELARQSNRAARATIRALTGVVPGSSKANTQARVSAPAGLTQNEQLGGLRVVEVVNIQTGNTAASDVTYINALINDSVYNQAPTSYPADLSGVGGGGKVGV